jgi:hypothetical protein
MHFRHTPPVPPPTLRDLALTPEMLPDVTIWVNELWNDFLLEPTPYIVASAIWYVGGVLLLVEYYWALWWLACFLFRLLPWDDELDFV